MSLAPFERRASLAALNGIGASNAAKMIKDMKESRNV